jgi:hypothetical protein
MINTGLEHGRTTGRLARRESAQSAVSASVADWSPRSRLTGRQPEAIAGEGWTRAAVGGTGLSGASWAAAQRLIGTRPRSCNSGRMRGFGCVVVAASLVAAAYRAVVTGELTLDTGVGRTVRTLGPLSVAIAASPDTVFDVVSAPYLARTPRALADEIAVLERGGDMVLAAHRTRVGPRLVATTVETVRFTPPTTVDFRLVRGPVPHVVERFTLVDEAGATRLEYAGELGADFWGAGRWWGGIVARRWVDAVRSSLERIRVEAERRADRSR